GRDAAGPVDPRDAVLAAGTGEGLVGLLHLVRPRRIEANALGHCEPPDEPAAVGAGPSPGDASRSWPPSIAARPSVAAAVRARPAAGRGRRRAAPRRRPSRMAPGP